MRWKVMMLMLSVDASLSPTEEQSTLEQPSILYITFLNLFVSLSTPNPMSDQVPQREPIQQPASFPATLPAEQVPQETSLADDSIAETSSTPAAPISTSTEPQIKVYNPVGSTPKADEGKWLGHLKPCYI